MIKILFLLIFGLNAGAQTTFIDGKYGVNTKLFTNYVKNQSCNKNVNNITASGGSLTRNTSSPLEDGGDCAIDASATAQTYSWSTFSLDNWLSGQNCEARFVYKGDASLYKAYVNVNSVKVTTDLQLQNSNSPSTQEVSINFPCGAQPLTTALVIESTGNGAAINVAKAYVGQATNVGTVAQAEFVGSIKWAGTTGCTWAVSGTTVANFATQASCPTPTTTGNVSAPGTKIPAVVIPNAKPGNYIFYARGFMYGNPGTEIRLRFSDGTNNSATSTFYGSGGVLVSGGGVNGDIPLSSPTTNWTVQMQGGNVAGNAVNIDNSSTTSTQNFEISVYRMPLASQQVLTPNLIPAYWGGYHDNTCGAWSRTSNTMGDLSADATCALVQRYASNISCSATGSVLPALNCTVPKAGTYQVCAQGAMYENASAGGAFGLSDGTTVLAESTTNAGTNGFTRTMCALMTTTSTSLTPKLQCRSNGSTCVITTNANSEIEWTVLDVSQNINAPVFVGSVTSNTTGSERVERVVFGGSGNTGCTTTPCTIKSQSGAWVTSISRSATGAYNVVVPSGMFSAAPTCLCTGENITTGPATCMVNPFTTTATSIDITNKTNAGGSVDDAFMLVCMGPR